METKNNHILIGLIVIFFIAISTFLYIQNQTTKNTLEIFKTETLNNIQTCSSDDKNSTYSKRLESLEQKYIDVLASKDTINFWITIFTILIPLVLGVQLYQKGKFEEESRKELDNIRDLAEKTRDKIDNIDKIIDSKIRKISTSAKDEIKKIIIEADKQRKISQYIDDGNKYYNEEKYEKAIKLYNDAIELDNNNPDIYFYKRTALIGLNKYPEALKNIDETIKLELLERLNDNYILYAIKGLILKKLNKYNEAIIEYNKSIELNNKDSSSYYNIACLYSLEKDSSKTLKNLEIAFDLGHFNDKEKIENFYTDTDFDNIRETKEFKYFVKKFEEKYPKKN